jgi:hypothetical protein
VQIAIKDRYQPAQQVVLGQAAYFFTLFYFLAKPTF